jgi:transcriptional regulator with XRE-family HTH domain
MKSHKEFKPTLITLGERIYHRRVLKNLTTKDIASRISLSPEAYRNIEKGITDPSFTTLMLIAKILEVNYNDLTNNLELQV